MGYWREGTYIRDADHRIIGQHPPEWVDGPKPKEKGGWAGIGIVIIVGLAWEIYRSSLRAIYGLPHQVQVLLYFLIGVLVCSGFYFLLVIIAQRVMRRRISGKAKAITYTVVFLALISNFVGLPAAEQARPNGATSTNIVSVPPRGGSFPVPVSGSTQFVSVRPEGSVWMFAEDKQVDPASYKPFVADRLIFVSRTGRPVTIELRQFAHQPTQSELAEPISTAAPRASR